MKIISVSCFFFLTFVSNCVCIDFVYWLFFFSFHYYGDLKDPKHTHTHTARSKNKQEEEEEDVN